MNLSREQIQNLVVLYQSGKLAEADTACEALLAIDPQSFAVNNIRGLIQQGLGRFEESLKWHDRAIAAAPQNARALCNRGMALMRLQLFDRSLADFDQAIAINPALEGAHFNRGLLLKSIGQLHRSVSSYEKAIQLQPGLAEAWSNLGNVLKELGRIDGAIQHYEKAVLLKPDSMQSQSNLLMAINYSTSHNNEERKKAAEEFGALLARRIKPAFKEYASLLPGRPLRIGLVSGDLREHPVGYFLENVLKALDSARIELFAYSTTPGMDVLSQRIQPLFTSWQSLVGLTDQAAARLINSEAIHVLLDLAGHTANNRLPVFAYKPAPLQVSWLGYFATTGLHTMDYLLGDPYLTPAGSEAQFVEKLYRLPETHWCYTPPDLDLDPSPLPALDNGFITFGCFHNLSKINSGVISLWAEILAAVPNSRLLLKSMQHRDPQVKKDLAAAFARYGLESSRLLLEDPQQRNEYFGAYDRIDIALDPFPFTGGATSIDGLWMGVPFLTLAGESLVARQGVSILMNMDLPDWIADSESQYLQKAIAFASDLTALSALRADLRTRLLQSPLCDAQRFAENFKKFLITAWENQSEEDS